MKDIGWNEQSKITADNEGLPAGYLSKKGTLDWNAKDKSRGKA